MKLFRSKDISSYTDEELILKYRKTEQNAYVGELYKRYSHLVFGVCLKYLKNEEDARDAVIQLFEKLMEDLKDHDIKRFKPWLHTVARNHCLMKLRKLKTERKRENEYKYDSPEEKNHSWQPEVNESSVEMKKEKQITLLEKGIESLKEEQRICIELFFLKELCYKEIAQKTALPMKKVKSHIQNGKRNLKIFMEKSGKQKLYT